MCPPERFGLLLVAALFGLVALPAAGQQAVWLGGPPAGGVPGRTDEPDPASPAVTTRDAAGGAAEGPRRPGERVVYLFDDFSAARLSPENWELAAGVRPTRELDDRGRPVTVARLEGASARTGRSPELRSVPLPLAGVGWAELSFTVRPRGLSAGRRLLVEYLSADGRWRPLGQIVSDDRDSPAFARERFGLPDDARHANARIRFRAEPSPGRGAWCLDEVVVAGRGGVCELRVRLWPERRARVMLVLSGGEETTEEVVPFGRALPAGTSLSLVAPSAVAGWVFSHWSLDGLPVPGGQRVLTLELSRSLEATAHYRPWIYGRTPARVTIGTSPELPVSIAVGPAPERLYAELSSPAEYEGLTGEWVTLLVPARTQRWVFVRWVVNGEPLSAADNLLEHRIRGDDTLLAEYARLGDMNGDGVLDQYDVDEFVLALVDPAAYAERYPELDRTRRGDINGDGVLDLLDVESLVDLMLHD